MTELTRYTKRVGALQLTVEPYSYAGHGTVDNTWVARVDLDVPAYGTTANVALKLWGRRNPAVARARAINVGHALLINSIIAGVGQPADDNDDEIDAKIDAHEQALMTDAYDHMFGE